MLPMATLDCMLPLPTLEYMLTVAILEYMLPICLLACMICVQDRLDVQVHQNLLPHLFDLQLHLFICYAY